MTGSKETPNPAAPARERWQVLAEQVGNEHDADVFLFSGGIEHEGADDLIRLAKRPDRRKNVVLLLTTRGGSADAAFRMARCLRTHYEKLVLYIHGMCKSAGTLVAVGVDEIVLSDFGEFGPLDVQLGKKDELFDSTSGLDVHQGLQSLNVRTFEFFRDVLIGIRRGTRGQISTKLAAELASELAIGVYGPIYGQVDPVQLGAIERAMRIAVKYGDILSRSTRNLKKDAVERLATSYPSHGFVIDLEEARTLFNSVRQPTASEEQLGECISHVTRDETDTSIVELLNDAKPPIPAPTTGNDHDEATGSAGEGTPSEQPGSREDHETARKELAVAAVAASNGAGNGRGRA